MSYLFRLATIYGVPRDAIKIVEAHYRGIIHEVAKDGNQESKEATKPVDEEKDFRNTARQAAEQSRMVK